MPRAKRKGDTKRTVIARQKRIDAWNMYADGMTTQEIADAMGYTNRSAVSKLLKLAQADYAKYERKTVEQYRDRELSLLDKWTGAIAYAASQGDLDAINTGLALMKQRDKYTGAALPIKIALESIDMAKFTDAEIASLLSSKGKQLEELVYALTIDITAN